MYTLHSSCQGDGIAHYLSLKPRKTDSVTYSVFSLSEIEVTGNLMAKNTLLISQPLRPPVCCLDVFPQASQGAAE